MRQLLALALTAGAVALAALNPMPAGAQGLATTTFVSGDGLDTNPCTHTLPCRSFQHAHDMTAAGGQITMLDPAGYGAVTISKSISIVNDGGGEAGITEPGSLLDAIDISAGASDVVNLRGLTLNGVGTGSIGIMSNNGATLNIQNCVIRGFTRFGVNVQAPAAITIADTIASNNGGGILIGPFSGTTSVSVKRVAAISNGIGFQLVGNNAGTVQGVIVDSVAIGNGAEGFKISPGFNGAAVTLINSKAIGNNVGVADVSPGTTYISGMTVVGNKLHGFSLEGSARW